MYEVSITEAGNFMVMGVGFIIVCVCGILDIRNREIPFKAVVIGGVIGCGSCFFQISQGSLSFGEMGLALLPGGFLLFLSLVSGEKVGYGDGLLLAVIGLFSGFYRCMFILCISLLLLSITALVLLVLHKVHRNSRLPFVPFLAAGMGVGFFV